MYILMINDEGWSHSIMYIHCQIQIFEHVLQTTTKSNGLTFEFLQIIYTVFNREYCGFRITM